MTDADKGMREFRIGCQSWGYDDWITPAGGETVFYPRGTRSADMLPFYAQIFDTIEVDATAYGVPQARSIETWLQRSPDEFIFSLKTPSEVTHEHSLGPQSYGVMDLFIERARGLGSKLGVILIQLPASFESTKENAKNLRDLISRLPQDIDFAVEFRHPGWFVDWTYEELNSRNIAVALVEGKWVDRELMFDALAKTTAEFAYIRFMGIRDLERFDRICRDRTDELRTWAEAIRGLHARRIFIYMDNYYEGHAPATANRMKEMLSLPARRPDSLDEQPSLF